MTVARFEDADVRLNEMRRRRKERIEIRRRKACTSRDRHPTPSDTSQRSESPTTTHFGHLRAPASLDFFSPKPRRYINIAQSPR
jgi:hypothetical protein